MNDQDQDQEDWAQEVGKNISEVVGRENSRDGHLLENLFD